MRYDFIADVHGYTDHLEMMLHLLGYRYRNGAYRHSDPNRMAVSVGDLMDRGPRQIDAIDIFRRMRDAGTGLAVMGNHEHAAIGWTIPDHHHPGEFLRRHSEKNLSHHKVFLEQVGENSPIHLELVSWMKTMPLSFEAPGIRCVHACWDRTAFATLADDLLADTSFNEEGLKRSYVRGTANKDAADVILRGPEIELPGNASYYDVAGHARTKARLRWWKNGSARFDELAITDDACAEFLKNAPMPADISFESEDNTPVIFGHYWFSGSPSLLSETRGCLDFSVAAGGPLVAYQWDGESKLTEQNLVVVA